MIITISAVQVYPNQRYSCNHCPEFLKAFINKICNTSFITPNKNLDLFPKRHTFARVHSNFLICLVLALCA